MEKIIKDAGIPSRNFGKEVIHFFIKMLKSCSYKPVIACHKRKKNSHLCLM